MKNKLPFVSLVLFILLLLFVDELSSQDVSYLFLQNRPPTIFKDTSPTNEHSLTAVEVKQS